MKGGQQWGYLEPQGRLHGIAACHIMQRLKVCHNEIFIS